jgi:hypothetical protein
LGAQAEQTARELSASMLLDVIAHLKLSPPSSAAISIQQRKAALRDKVWTLASTPKWRFIQRHDLPKMGWGNGNERKSALDASSSKQSS